MTICLTKEQKLAVEGIKDWFQKGTKESCTLVGFAGSGKTFLVNHIIESLPIKLHEVAFVAFTGKASLLLKQSNPKYHCSTIHKLIYKLDEESSKPIFILKEKDKLKGIKLIVVDEASMVSKKMYDDLLTFGIPLLLIGDEGQLPPIGDQINLLENADFRLTEIHRQAAGNPIIHLSMLARTGRKIEPGSYGNTAYVMSKSDFKPELMDKVCLRADQILCGYNATRKMLNQKVRRLKGFTSPFPQVGDKMICTKNAWDHELKGISLVNGMTGFVEQVTKTRKTSEIKRECLSIDFRPDFIQKEHFKDLLVIEDDFKNKQVALTGSEYKQYQKMEFGEAITVHKAQGGSYEKVLVFNEVLNSREHKKWLYTAITRASKSLILVM